ncbi:Polyketide cyclase / dehydrase and lipid transport [compost metagenome]
MKMELRTEIVIEATPGKIWGILTAFDRYPDWNPFIKFIEGEQKVGAKIRAQIAPPGAKGMTFKPTVLAFEKEKEFKWIGRLLFPGLFDGEHRFQLIDNGNGTCTFIQAERFKGILVPLFKKMLETNTLEGFHTMNRHLKEEAERLY